jgi:peptide/nickel transport system permease protein
MYLAGSFLMFLAMLTVFGVLISDIALAFLDPRIRLGGTENK